MTDPVVNTSPLIHLGDAGKLDLLRDLFGSVLVPRAVSEELLAKGDGDWAACEFSRATWLRVIDVADIPQSIVAWDLGVGETAVLTQALLHENTEAIIDDLSARRCAQSLGIPVCGTLGLVLRAARKGIVADPSAVIMELHNAGMWLSPWLLQMLWMPPGNSNRGFGRDHSMGRRGIRAQRHSSSKIQLVTYNVEPSVHERSLLGFRRPGCHCGYSLAQIYGRPINLG